MKHCPSLELAAKLRDSYNRHDAIRMRQVCLNAQLDKNE